MKRLTKAAVMVLAAVLCLLPVLSLGASAVPALQKGDKLTVSEVETDASGAVWYRLRLPDGSTAYLPADALTAEISAASAASASAASASAAASAATSASAAASAASSASAAASAAATTSSAVTSSSQSSGSTMVWVSGTGKKYHSKSSCSNMKSPRQITRDEAVRQGYTPCKKCY